MDVKERLYAACDGLAAVIGRGVVEYGHDVLEQVERIRKSIRDYEFRVYLVGPFSCGKSSLLNRWMSADILSTGPAPETGVSTELHYDTRERIELVSLNAGDPDEVLPGLGPSNMAVVRERANAGTLANVRVYASNPVLSAYSDICLVDLPGLSSAKPAHEAALTRFAAEPRRTAVFCLPLGNGTLSETERQFLIRMRGLNSEFKAVLTRADQVPVSDREACRVKLRQDIEAALGEETDIRETSFDSADGFVAILDGYLKMKDAYLLRRFSSELVAVSDALRAPLRRIVAHDYRQDAEVDDALARIKDAIDRIPEAMADIEKDMSDSLSAAASEVMLEVRQAVDRQSGVIAGKSSAAATSEISSLVKSIIAYQAPAVMRDLVERSNARASSVFEEDMNGLDSAGLEIHENDSEERACAEDQQFAVTSTSEPLPRSVSGSGWLGDFAANSIAREIGFYIGNLLLPGVGGGLGVVVGLIGSALYGKQKEADEQNRREAEYAQKMDQAMAEASVQVEDAFAKASGSYLKGLRAQVEKRIRTLSDQMLEMKRVSETDRSEWEALQLRCRAEMSAIDDVNRLLEERQ